MEPPRLYFARLAGGVRGPFAAEHLRDLGEVQQLTAETEIATHPAGPWTPLGALPSLCAEVFPARRVLGFKSDAAFETLNADATPAVTIDEINAAAERIPASFRGREVVVTPQTLRGTRDGEPPNEVQQMVQEVGRRVAAHAPPEILPPPPPRFPRWRWFLALGVLGTAGILCIPRFYPDRKSDEFTFSILAGWIVLYDGFLVFVMVAERGFRERLLRRKLQLDLRRGE
jgi:hypothetical protein